MFDYAKASSDDAWVVELVDTPDLKSCGPKARAGSIPVPSTEAGNCC